MSAITPKNTGKKATKLTIPKSPNANTLAIITPVANINTAIIKVVFIPLKDFEPGLNLIIVYNLCTRLK